MVVVGSIGPAHGWGVLLMPGVHAHRATHGAIGASRSVVVLLAQVRHDPQTIGVSHRVTSLHHRC